MFRYETRMSVYIRPHWPGARVFFTVCLAEQGATLLVDEIDRLREAFRETLRERPFAIETMVVMPDHLHCIWKLPEGDADFSTRWGAIKARFTMAVRRAGVSGAPSYPIVPHGRYAGLKPGVRVNKREVVIWRRRFWEHHIRGPKDHEAALEFCWNDPVKHGFVSDPRDWPFASWSSGARAAARPPKLI